jgi:ferritin-like metal-binding protein YciE
LQETLEEEKETDQKLTELSQQINMQANEGGGEKKVTATGSRKPRRAA